jgi:hypothetical protein
VTWGNLEADGTIYSVFWCGSSYTKVCTSTKGKFYWSRHGGFSCGIVTFSQHCSRSPGGYDMTERGFKTVIIGDGM